jgi:hypothetical protein
MPPGMLTMRIDSETGEPVGAGHPRAIFEVFEVGKAPSAATDKRDSDSQKEPTGGSVKASEDPF